MEKNPKEITEKTEIKETTPLFVDPRSHFEKIYKFPPADQIKIYDTTLRDGEQMPGVSYTPEQKFEIAKKLSDIGVHIIDMGFPGVSESERKALKMIVEGKKRGEIRKDLEILIMCRCNQRDIDSTIDTLAEIGCKPDEITFLLFSSATDLHIKYKLGPLLLKSEGKSPDDLETTPIEWLRKANCDMVHKAVKYAKSRGVASIELGTEDASRSEISYLIELIKAGVEAGADRYIFPDTTGVCTPASVEFYVGELKKAFPDLPMVSHFHNDFDFSTINVLTSIRMGMSSFSCTVNGLGERAGNARLHSCLMGLKYMAGIEIPGFQYQELWNLTALVEKLSGIPVQVHEPVIGNNVFTHETGIHTHGVLADRRTYESLEAEFVGGVRKFVFGKHSGRHVVEHALHHFPDILKENQIELTSDFVQKVVQRVKEIGEESSGSPRKSEGIESYYQSIRNLSLSEKQVLDIAVQISKES